MDNAITPSVKDQSIHTYLADQREKGRPTVLAFPTLFPREIPTALDLCVWERWSTRPDLHASNAGKLQGYLCPTVRGAQAALARDDHHAIAAIVPHTCDSMQGLASIANATPAWKTPILTFRHPRGSDRPASRLFLRDEVLAFLSALESASGRKLEKARLSQAIALHQEVESLLKKVLHGLPWLHTPAESLYATLRLLEYSHPEDMLKPLSTLASSIDRSRKREGVGVLISGMVPEPPGFFQCLEDAGGFVAADDYAGFGRRLPAYHGPSTGPGTNDPIDTVVERLLQMPPCPTRASNVKARIEHLTTLAQQSDARGVILHTVKFCEPELFDIPSLRHSLEKNGLRVLQIETEFEPSVTGQVATRLEAFLEMLQNANHDANHDANKGIA
jgi:benzoyl-CoA reductase/2-hydroxyglutaryl-CoA dehydratase subunit BcrC/BadD/HgdB